MVTAAPVFANEAASLQDDLRAVIEQAIRDHPRSQQAEIGASEVDAECPRKLAHKLAGTPRVRPEKPGWRPTVGTAVHTWLEGVFTADNARRVAQGLEERWLLETTLDCGTLNGRTLTGHGDLFDLLTGTAVDWKIPGVTTIKKARAAKSPGRQYRGQTHLYGMGYALLGFVVRQVAVYMLPSAGELADGYFWSEPFDPMIAVKALERANGLADAYRTLGPDLFAHLPIAEDYCAHCPWWQPGENTDLRIACPGDPAAARVPARRLSTFDPTAGRTHTPTGTTHQEGTPA